MKVLVLLALLGTAIAAPQVRFLSILIISKAFFSRLKSYILEIFTKNPFLKLELPMAESSMAMLLSRIQSLIKLFWKFTTRMEGGTAEDL